MTLFRKQSPRFRDRHHAGAQLAQALTAYANRGDIIVLGLPRGGVPVAFEVAKALHAPLDIFLVRKLGAPGHEELAMGAIASGGVRVLNDEVVRSLNIAPHIIDRVAAQEQQELERREHAYRNGRPALPLAGHTVILVDDGLATGASMSAVVAGVRAHHPAHVVVAVPVAAAETCALLEGKVDEIVCTVTPQPFLGVGAWYQEFAQTTDDEVIGLLEEARQYDWA